MRTTFTVSRIAVQGKRKKVYAVYSDAILLFEINEDTLVHFALSKGVELTSEKIESIRYTNDLNECRAQAYRYLSRRAHLSRELATKLRHKGYSQLLIDDALAQLIKNKLLDDREFIHLFIREKINISLSGPLLISKKLQEKGANRDEVDEILSTDYPEELQMEIAGRVIRKKTKVLAGLSGRQQLDKLRRALKCKGFYGAPLSRALQNRELNVDVPQD